MPGEVPLRHSAGRAPQDSARYSSAIQVRQLRQELSPAIYAQCSREKVAHAQDGAMQRVQFYGRERDRCGETQETAPLEFKVRDLQLELRRQGDSGGAHDNARSYAISTM